jgi:hypothetical protein
VEALCADERARPDLVVRDEAERLHAFLDGLAMHATLEPDLTTPARQVELLSLHLDSLGWAPCNTSNYPENGGKPNRHDR